MFTIHFNYKWKSFDGLAIHAEDWRPDFEPKAVICLVHGIGEHIGRYNQWAQRFTDYGIAVLACDYRGHGQSEGKKGHTDSFDSLVNDVDLLVNKAEEIYPGIPKILYGHSLGGNMVLNYSLRKESNIKAVVASSPWLGLAFEPSAVKRLVGMVMNFLHPSFMMKTDIKKEDLSQDEKVMESYHKDPLSHNETSVRLYFSAEKAAKWAMNNASNMKYPVLLMHGDADRVTSFKATERFAQNCPDNSELKIWDGLYHELHNSVKKDEVFKFVLDWVNGILG